MLFCNVLSPQLFWFRWCRRHVLVVFFVCMCVNAGMWFERFITRRRLICRFPAVVLEFIIRPGIWTIIGTLGIFTSVSTVHRFCDDRNV
jgi:molybdopterin-containing oxidoreductase family membrane subunit